MGDAGVSVTAVDEAGKQHVTFQLDLLGSKGK